MEKLAFLSGPPLLPERPGAAKCGDRAARGVAPVTWSGMTIMKIFLSLSERMCLMKAQPVPMSAMVMNSSAPFKLKKENVRHERASLESHPAS